MEQKRLRVDAVDDGHDFIVQLLTLVHGWGQISKVDMLRFKSKTSFWHFIATLKTETRESMIPPENVIFPPILLSEPPMDNRIPDPISDVPAKIRDPNDRGYSLSDGPWMYKLPHVGKDDAQKPGWKCIKDENEYMIMLDGIKAVNSKYVEWKQPSKCSVAIMHVSTLPQPAQALYSVLTTNLPASHWIESVNRDILTAGRRNALTVSSGRKSWKRQDSLMMTKSFLEILEMIGLITGREPTLLKVLQRIFRW